MDTSKEKISITILDGNICQQCGMCCNGTLYSHVVLRDEEPGKKFEALGLEVRQEGDKHQVTLPCKALHGKCCSIYQSRPSICREYRCNLLRSYEANEISEEKALTLIRETEALAAAVRPRLETFLGIDETIPMPNLIQRASEKLDNMDQGERKKIDGKLLLELGTLRIVLAKRFDPRGTVLEGEPHPR